MNKYKITKALFVIVLLVVMFTLLYINKTYTDRFESTEDHGYFGEEVTGDIPRLVYVENREGLDSEISSTNADRMFNQAYVDQYKDSYLLSNNAKLLEYQADNTTTSAVLEFDNGSILSIKYSEKTQYVGSIEVSTNVVKSARKGDNS